jgi:acyl carrier protein
VGSIYESVVEVVSSRFGIDKAEVIPEASFDDLGLDSLSQIELATALQRRLGVVFTDEEIIEISDVSDVVTKLQEKGFQP